MYAKTALVIPNHRTVSSNKNSVSVLFRKKLHNKIVFTHPLFDYQGALYILSDIHYSIIKAAL